MTDRITEEERKEILREEIASRVRRGWRIESKSVFPKPVMKEPGDGS